MKRRLPVAQHFSGPSVLSPPPASVLGSPPVVGRSSSGMFAARTLKYAPVSTLVLGLLLSACGGGGGGGDDGGGQPPPPTMVTATGRVTYARVPFRPFPTTGLDYNGTFQDAASGIRV